MTQNIRNPRARDASENVGTHNTGATFLVLVYGTNIRNPRARDDSENVATHNTGVTFLVLV